MPLSISSFKRFLALYVSLSAILLLIIATATEMMIRTYVEPIDLFEQSVDVFMAAETDNAFFGDSIIAAGIIPETKDYVNLAIGGESPAMMLEKVKIFYANKSSGRAIIPANVNMLTRQLTSFADYTEVLIVKERPPIRLMTLRHRAYAFDYWKRFLFDEFSTRRKLLPLGGEVFSDPALNNLFAEKTAEERMSNARGKVAQYLNIGKERIDANKQIFEEILVFLNSHNIETCLLSFPMSQEIRQLGTDHDVISNSLNFFRTKAEDHNMKYVNARDMFSTPEKFIDATHMSEPAARQFTDYAYQACFSDGGSSSIDQRTTGT